MNVSSPSPKRRFTVSLMLWICSSMVGSVFAILAMHEVALNWRALRRVRPPDGDLLAEILIGNLYQQVTRLVMEGMCWTAGVVSYSMPESGRSRSQGTSIIVWLLVAFRLLLTFNNAIEYLSNRERRNRLARRSSSS